MYEIIGQQSTIFSYGHGPKESTCLRMAKTIPVSQRLKAMRLAAGFSTRELAELIELPHTTYTSYEAVKYKKASLPATLVEALAPHFIERKIEPKEIWKLVGTPADLLDQRPIDGDEEPSFEQPDFDPDAADDQVPDAKPAPGMSIIEEVNVAAGQANGGQVHGSADLQYDHERVIARWHIPTDVVRLHTRSPADKIKIITAVGDSNKPDIMPGERLMIDTSDRIPTPGGYFAIWDGLGEIVKKLSFVEYSDPPMVRLVSSSPDKETYPTRELPLVDLTINGRVVGRWDRL